MASFCGYCGSELDTSARFCPACGKPIADRADATPTSSHQDAQSDLEERVPRRRRSRPGLLVLIVVGIAGSVFGVLLLTGAWQAGTPAAQPSTTTSILGSTSMSPGLPDPLTTSTLSIAPSGELDLEVVPITVPLSGEFSPLSFSPDGKWMLTTIAMGVVPESSVCLAAVDGTGESCVDWPGWGFESIAWAGDSARVVFTESAHLYGYVSGIWVWDTTTGELEDWTDDGLNPAEGGRPDMGPVWMTDEVWFARREAGEPWKVMAANGQGTARTLCEVDGPRVTPDGTARAVGYPALVPFGDSSVALSLEGQEGQSTLVWVCRNDGVSTTMELAPSSPDIGLPRVVARLGDGRLLLLYDGPEVAGARFYEVADSDGKNRIPVVRRPEDPTEYHGPLWVMVVGDGSRLIAAVQMTAPLIDQPVVSPWRLVEVDSDTLEVDPRRSPSILDTGATYLVPISSPWFGRDTDAPQRRLSELLVVSAVANAEGTDYELWQLHVGRS